MTEDLNKSQGFKTKIKIIISQIETKTARYMHDKSLSAQTHYTHCAIGV